MNRSTFALGEICNFIKGEYPALKTKPGKYPLVVTAAFRRSSETYQLEGPAVCIPLVSSTGHGDAAIHRIHYQEGKFALSNILVALIPKVPKECNAKYLYYLLSALKDEYLVPLMRGGANVSLKDYDIAKVDVVLPSFSEQTSTVSKIEKMFEKIHTSTSLHDSFSKQFNTLHQAAYLKFFKSTNQYQKKPLLDTLKIIGNQVSSQAKPYCNQPYISLGNVETNTGKLLNIKSAKENKIRGTAVCFKDENVLISKLRPYLNKVVIPDFVGTASTEMVVLRPNSSMISREYLAAFLRNPDFVYEATDFSIGAKMPRINMRWFKKLSISLPPLKKQKEVAERLNALTEIMNSMKPLGKDLDKTLKILKQSILWKIFT